MIIKKTGVKATKAQFDQLVAAANSGWRTGDVMIVGSLGEGIRRDTATVDAAKLCHQFALANGLPEITGYYGIDEDGEFVTTG